MAVLDVDKLLAEVSADSPAGEDLSYDAAYLNLFTQAQGTPEQQMGDHVVEAQEPNWREVREGCTEILKRSKDLRVAVLASVVALKLDGLPGMAAGLALLRGLLDKYWDTFYPRLDPSDNNDPLERVNIIAALAAAPQTLGDPLKVQERLRAVPLCASPRVGRFGLRDLAAANGEAVEGSAPRVEMSVIDAAVDDTPIEELKALGDAADACVALAAEVDSILESKVGASAAPDLSPFQKCLQEIRATMQKFLARRGYGQAPAAAAAGGNAQAADASGGGPALSGEVRSTQDVLLAIDRICQYYERVEPSSPVPLLLKRARRLVSKSFLDVIKDLSPDAVSQIKLIGGIVDEAS